MKLFQKIMTAIRGGASEAGEAIVDANATRIFEQEIRDAETHITKAKHDLTGVMAQEMQSARRLDTINSSIVEHEGYAVQALEKGDDELALKIAEKIASLEVEQATEKSTHDKLKSSSERLKSIVRKSEKVIIDHRRELDMVKTTESVQKATSAISDNFSSSNSKLLSAKDSLERIKKKQQMFDDKQIAAEELQSESNGGGLEADLRAAGIGEGPSSANSVLERLKSKK